ncbi:unnamed protein product [Auanema sp. JU1783]|nr:unnamed protein product [Auanema sp. JU1783]
MDPPTQFYETNDSARQRSSTNPNMKTDGKESNLPFGDMQSQLGKMVWEAGSKQVQDTFKSYGRIDLFRPYFDVEPAEVRSRLIRSFIPRKPSQMASVPDLYGPSMIVLTMAALLLFNMKTSGYVVPNGTLMGTSLFVCFGSWLGISGIIYFIGFLLNTEMTMLKLISVFGYSLTSHCVVLFLSSVFHPSHDHIYFFLLVLLLCAPSAIRMGLIVCMQVRVPQYRMILGAVACFLHFVLIFYLHFGFHVMLEELDQMIEGVASGKDIPQ